jgi:hypothetical protein
MRQNYKEPPMKKWMFAGLIVLCVSASATRVTFAHWGHEHNNRATLRATLLGAHQVPPINTEAMGRFAATVHHDDTITFEVTFENLSGGPLFQATINFAQFNVNGGVMISLCGAPTQPPCPPETSGSFTGTITPANVIGPANQGIAAGDLASALRVIGQGEGYVNLRTARFANPGEIRGQIKVHGHSDDDDDND